MTNAVRFAISILVLANGLLLWHNRSLRAQLAAQVSAYELATGVEVPTLRGYDKGGSPIEVSFRAAPASLLLAFSPHCPHCATNWPQWDRLINTARITHARVIGLDLTNSAPAAYTEGHFGNIAVMSQLDPRVIKAYRLRLTPQTLLIDSNARVAGVWTGTLTDADLAAIDQTMRQLAH